MTPEHQTDPAPIAPRHVFISFASADAPLAHHTVASLEQSGLRCWFSDRDIEPAASYPATITDAVKSSGAVLLLLTETSNQSPHVIREIELAFSARRPILPVRIGGATPSPDLQWAGTATRYYDSLPSIAWFSDNSDEGPHAVGGKAANPYGLHDMLGNVSEWVLDRYYNAYDETSDPAKVEEPLAGNASGVARGGSWVSDADGVRVSRRLEMPPDAEEPHIGFRCVVDKL